MDYSFILVEPKVPENIGASARALKTMGFSSLVLINPCEDPEGRSRWLAHGSNEILDNAMVYGSLEEAISGFDLLIATTTRKRKLQNELVPAAKLTGFIENKGSTVSKVGIVFGNEESGLSNMDLSLCHISSGIPLATEFPSLNLSQAVMLYAYELSSGLREIDKSSNKDYPGENSHRIIVDKVKELLDETGLSKNPALSGKIIERLAHTDEKDLKLIHSISGTILELLKNNR